MASRREMYFWDQLNAWWRDLFNRTGRRPTSSEVHGWYGENADTVWPIEAERPSYDEVRLHCKGIRQLGTIAEYFRDLRRRKTGSSKGPKRLGVRHQGTKSASPAPAPTSAARKARGQAAHLACGPAFEAFEASATIAAAAAARAARDSSPATSQLTGAESCGSIEESSDAPGARMQRAQAQAVHAQCLQMQEPSLRPWHRRTSAERGGGSGCAAGAGATAGAHAHAAAAPDGDAPWRSSSASGTALPPLQPGITQRFTFAPYLAKCAQQHLHSSDPSPPVLRHHSPQPRGPLSKHHTPHTPAAANAHPVVSHSHGYQDSLPGAGAAAAAPTAATPLVPVFQELAQQRQLQLQQQATCQLHAPRSQQGSSQGLQGELSQGYGMFTLFRHKRRNVTPSHEVPPPQLQQQQQQQHLLLLPAAPAPVGSFQPLPQAAAAARAEAPEAPGSGQQLAGWLQPPQLAPQCHHHYHIKQEPPAHACQHAAAGSWTGPPQQHPWAPQGSLPSQGLTAQHQPQQPRALQQQEAACSGPTWEENLIEMLLQQMPQLMPLTAAPVPAQALNNADEANVSALHQQAAALRPLQAPNRPSLPPLSMRQQQTHLRPPPPQQQQQWTLRCNDDPMACRAASSSAVATPADPWVVPRMAARSLSAVGTVGMAAQSLASTACPTAPPTAPASAVAHASSYSPAAAADDDAGLAWVHGNSTAACAAAAAESAPVGPLGHHVTAPTPGRKRRHADISGCEELLQQHPAVAALQVAQHAPAAPDLPTHPQQLTYVLGAHVQPFASATARAYEIITVAGHLPLLSLPPTPPQPTPSGGGGEGDAGPLASAPASGSVMMSALESLSRSLLFSLSSGLSVISGLASLPLTFSFSVLGGAGAGAAAEDGLQQQQREEVVGGTAKAELPRSVAAEFECEGPAIDASSHMPTPFILAGLELQGLAGGVCDDDDEPLQPPLQPLTAIPAAATTGAAQREQVPGQPCNARQQHRQQQPALPHPLQPQPLQPAGDALSSSLDSGSGSKALSPASPGVGSLGLLGGTLSGVLKGMLDSWAHAEL